MQLVILKDHNMYFQITFSPSMLLTYILYKILAYRIRCKIHAYLIDRKLRLREVGLFSIGLHHKPGIQDTSLTPVMAPGPLLKPWMTGPGQTLICLFMNKVQ